MNNIAQTALAVAVLAFGWQTLTACGDSGDGDGGSGGTGGAAEAGAPSTGGAACEATPAWHCTDPAFDGGPGACIDYYAPDQETAEFYCDSLTDSYVDPGPCNVTNSGGGCETTTADCKSIIWDLQNTPQAELMETCASLDTDYVPPP
ncbi:MAG: hypothetical protein HOW73_27145 [Polyangiaceae bacterium]|nr:hypothetical protein [Polyangiaceae bacterium]